MKKVWKRLGRREWRNGDMRESESVSTFCTTPKSTADNEPVPPFPSLLSFSSLLFSIHVTYQTTPTLLPSHLNTHPQKSSNF